MRLFSGGAGIYEEEENLVKPKQQSSIALKKVLHDQKMPDERFQILFYLSLMLDHHPPPFNHQSKTWK